MRCPLAGTEIRGDAITWLGYARGSGRRSSGLGGPLEVFFVPLGPSHFIAIGFRDSTGTEGSATFSYDSRLRGADVDALLRFLSRIGRVPILASEEDATKLPADLPKTVTSDPLKVLDPAFRSGVATDRDLGGTDHVEMIPDGSAVLTDKGLWSVPEGRLRCLLPSELRKSLRDNSVRLATISPDGRTLVALHNSGAANGKAALRAGNLTLVDIPTGKSRGRTGCSRISLTSSAARMVRRRSPFTDVGHPARQWAHAVCRRPGPRGDRLAGRSPQGAAARTCLGGRRRGLRAELGRRVARRHRRITGLARHPSFKTARPTNARPGSGTHTSSMRRRAFLSITCRSRQAPASRKSKSRRGRRSGPFAFPPRFATPATTERSFWRGRHRAAGCFGTARR